MRTRRRDQESLQDVSRRDALRFVLSYACANDVSAHWQKRKVAASGVAANLLIPSVLSDLVS